MSDILDAIRTMRAEFLSLRTAVILRHTPFTPTNEIYRFVDETDDIICISETAWQTLLTQVHQWHDREITTVAGIPVLDYDADRHGPIIERITRKNAS